MLDKPPSESERLSWTYAGLFALLIFFTIPFARAVQNYVSDSFGRDFFLYVVGSVAVAAAYKAFVTVRKRQLGIDAYAWLVVVGSAFAIYTYNLRRNPEEALHFVEYGILSLLIYRALVHRVHDYSIYLTATIVVGSIGVIDEWIQWLTPSRYWGLRDIQINLVAGGLIQLAILGGLRPTIVKAVPDFASLGILFRATAVGLLLFGLTLVITPARITQLATGVPGLSFLMEGRHVMIEYGYLYQDPEIGVFRSRFTEAELAEYDRLRGVEAASTVDEYISAGRTSPRRSEEKYRLFLRIYSVPRDAYIHEIGVHLFRRNRYLTRAQTEQDEAPQHYNVAFRENQILDKYYPSTLRNSSHLWTEDMLVEIGTAADKETEYESRVSAGLITRLNERQAMTGLSLAILGSILLAAHFGRKSKSVTARSIAQEE